MFRLSLVFDDTVIFLHSQESVRLTSFTDYTSTRKVVHVSGYLIVTIPLPISTLILQFFCKEFSTFDDAGKISRDFPRQNVQHCMLLVVCPTNFLTLYVRTYETVSLSLPSTRAHIIECRLRLFV